MDNTKATVSTQMDDTLAEVGQNESELLDAVLSNSQFLQQEESLPAREVPELDPNEESEVEDPEEDSELADDEDYEVDLEDEEIEEDDAEEASTDSDFIPLEELDLEAKTAVIIDGEEVEVSLGDLVKGYSTEQSLSKKGRELGEARKQIEAEREERLGELNSIAQVAATVIVNQEEQLQKEYHDLEAKIKVAREEDDTYELTKLKDQQSEIQKNYWNTRNQREQMLSKVQEFQEQQQLEQWNKEVQYFNENIENYIPSFNSEIASDIRNFALEEGLSEEVVDTVVDPVAIKILHDYMQLKKGVSKGTAKRKAVATKKAPVRKAKPVAKKKQDQEAMVKARAFREDASAEDQMAFLKQYASNTLNNL